MSGRFPGLWLLSSVVCFLLFVGNTSADVPSDSPPQSIYDLTTYFAVDPALEKAYQLYLRDELNEARGIVEAFLSAHPDFQGRHALKLLIADIASQRGDPVGAERLLTEVADYPPLVSIAMTRLGKLRKTRGDQEGALDAYAAVRPGSPEYPKAREQRARILLSRRQFLEAREDALDAAMDAATEKDRNRGYLLVADVDIASGSRTKALKILQELWWSRAKQESEILERLTRLGAVPDAVDSILREFDALSRYNVGSRKKDLRKRLRTFNVPRNRGLRELGEAMIRIHIKKERDSAPELIALAQKVAKKEGRLAPWIRLGEARALRKLDRDLEAAESYLKLVEDFPDHLLVPRALLGAGELLVRHHLPLEGERALRELIARYPQAQERPRALWEMAWSQYLDGSYRRSISFLNQLIRSHPTGTSPRGGLWREVGLYWKARALLKDGQKSEAIKVFRQVLVGYPLGYYALLSYNRLEAIDKKLVQGLGGNTLSAGQVSEIPMTVSSYEIHRHPTLDTAVELLRAGLVGSARDELQARLRSGDLSGDGLTLLVAIHQTQGHDGRARREMRLYAHRSSMPVPATQALWQEANPVEYLDLVERFSRENGLPTALILGLIRRESNFNPRARSYARALGLMQLLAPVGREVAVKLLDYKRLAARDLYKPHINIQIGTRLLREFHRLYRGNSCLAIAAYNAGAGSVRKWLHRHGHLDTDEFVEVIPFKGTASYVKKVLTSTAVYGALYGESGGWAVDLHEKLPVELGSFMQKDEDS